MTSRLVGTLHPMTDNDTPETPDHDEATEAPARPRVPNVRPGAVSGLDNELLNPDDAAAAEAAADADTVLVDAPPEAKSEDQTDDDIEVPDEGVFDWIEAGQNSDEQADRATAAYRKAADAAAQDGATEQDTLFRDALMNEYGGIIAPQDQPPAQAEGQEGGEGTDPDSQA